MTTKMQQLLDLIVNEEMDKANELFHEIVVEKSREIYENLISEEEDEEEMDEASEEDDESVDEASEEEDDESVDEGFGADETEMNVGDEPDADPADALMHDTEVGGDDMGGEEDGGAPATKDDVQDLEDALAELKAEFEALMGGSGEETDDEFGGEEEDGEEADDEFGGEEEADDEDDQDESMGVVREYREKVGNDWQGSAQKAQGKSLGANTGETYPAPVEGKSPISSGKGKPTTGANANNILAKSEGEGTNTGTSPNADKGSRGLAGSTKGEFTNGVTVNKNGSTTGVKTLSKVAGGHGAEKKGSAPGPVGSGSGDKAGQTSVGQAKSPLNGAPNRNA